MKRYIFKSIYAAGIVCGMMSLTSCELDRLPETTLADNTFWQSETDLRGACNKLYVDLQGFSHDTRADDIIGTAANATSSGSWSIPATSGEWTNAYQKIFVCNNIIEKGGSAPLTDAQKNRWLAEAYFFRAFHFFDLVKKYGDVPLILKAFDSTSDPDIKMARTPREQVIQQCYADLKLAEQYLPDIDQVSSAADWGRVSKSAAMGMLVRIGLYEGTFSKYHNLGGDYKSHLKVSIDAAERLIQSGKHDLYPDFQKLFYFDGEGRKNKENVFVKIYGPNGDGAVITHNNSRGMENAVSVTRQTIDQILYTDGLPREKTTLKVEEHHHNDVFINRDPRMAMTFYQKDEEAYKAGYNPFGNQHGNGYGLKKGFMLEEWNTTNKETVDKMIIRYAEILISYAEALYEYNGQITDAQLNATVNMVRHRSGFEALLTNAFCSANGLNMLDEIRRERLVEFIDENLRYNDIIRWKIAEKVLPQTMLGLKYNDEDYLSTQRENIQSRLTDANGMFNGRKVADQEGIYVIEDASNRTFNAAKDYYYPIPTYEIATSEGNVIQNPGWN
ncbi:MAG: RagB/SusD family nutrient uptake outer membrane protein [Bacteroidales bacterium]|nr:RagB/SusD family nutrient uptake outer membrane protein [Bacteroidales bacterium]